MAVRTSLRSIRDRRFRPLNFRLETRGREFPCNRELRVRLIRAEGARLDTSREHIAEPGIRLRDSFQHRLDGFRDALPGAFRGRCGPPITSSESDRAREFLGQRLELLFRALGTRDVAERFRLFEFFLPARQTRFAGFVIFVLACNSTDQVEHMEFDPRMTQQMGEVSEPFGVFQTKGIPGVADGPVLALFAENARLRGTDVRRRVVGTRRSNSSAPGIRCHLNFTAVRATSGGPVSGEMLAPRQPSYTPYCAAIFHAFESDGKKNNKQ